MRRYRLNSEHPQMAECFVALSALGVEDIEVYAGDPVHPDRLSCNGRKAWGKRAVRAYAGRDPKPGRYVCHGAAWERMKADHAKHFAN